VRFLGRTGETDVANKKKEEQGKTNMATKEGQRDRKNKKKKKRLDMSCHENP